MTDIKLNAATGDVDITNGSASLVMGIDSSAQDLLIALQSFQGDWFLDLNDGLPYIGRIFVKNVNEADIQQLFFNHAASRPRVVSVERMEITLTPTSGLRQLRIDGSVTFAESAESVPIGTTLTGLP